RVPRFGQEMWQGRMVAAFAALAIAAVSAGCGSSSSSSSSRSSTTVRPGPSAKCSARFEATVRKGAGAGKTYGGVLALKLDTAGQVTGGTLRTIDGKSLAVTASSQ